MCCEGRPARGAGPRAMAWGAVQRARQRSEVGKREARGVQAVTAAEREPGKHLAPRRRRWQLWGPSQFLNSPFRESADAVGVREQAGSL